MSNYAFYVPLVVRVKKAEDITRKILSIQLKEQGKISIISIHQDVVSKDWVILYYPFKNTPVGAL